MSSELLLAKPNLDLYERELVFFDGLPVVAGYARVSTEDQADDNHSIATQFQFIRERCQRDFPDGFHLLLISDDGLSGDLPYLTPGYDIENYRPGLTTVTQLIAKGIAKYVAVYTLSRLSRSTLVYRQFCREYLNHYGARLISCCESVDLSNAAGKYVSDLIVIQNEYVRRQIVERCRDGQLIRLKSGYPLGSPGYGWQWQSRRNLQKDSAGRKPYIGIEQVPEQVGVVRAIFDWCLDGKGVEWIRQQLAADCIKSPSGDQHWSKSTVLRIMHNPHHAGMIKIDLNGTLIDGAHYDQRIVEKSEYFAALEALRSRAQVPSKTKASPNHVFGEKIHCAKCGRRMNLITVPGRKARYKCRGADSANAHLPFSVRVDVVEEWAVQSLAEASAAPETFRAVSSDIGKIIAEQDENLVQHEMTLAAKLEANRKEFVDWARKRSRGELTEWQFDSYKDDLRRNRDELECALKTVRRQLEHKLAREVRVQAACSLLGRFREIWDSSNLAEKRELARELVDDLTVVYEGEHVQMKLRSALGTEHSCCIRPTGNPITGISALNQTQLISVYYLAAGKSCSEIAHIRNMRLRTIYGHQARLLELAETAGLNAALKLAAPMVAARIDQQIIESDLEFKRSVSIGEMELQLMNLLSRKLTLVRAASEMHIKPSRAATLRQEVYTKLGVHSLGEALASLRRRHLIAGTSTWSDVLTDNQMAVLRLLAAGNSQSEIARKLKISLPAVKERIRCMFDKFGVRPVAALLNFASSRGWV